MPHLLDHFDETLSAWLAQHGEAGYILGETSALSAAEEALARASRELPAGDGVRRAAVHVPVNFE